MCRRNNRGFLKWIQNEWGTIDNIHTWRQIIEKAYKIQMDILFIDFKQAFDTIYRNKMIKILQLQGIPSKFIR